MRLLGSWITSQISGKNLYALGKRMFEQVGALFGPAQEHVNDELKEAWSPLWSVRRCCVDVTSLSN